MCVCACVRVLQEWRGAGVAVPVFGLRSEAGMGVGEFLDLAPTVDLCAKAKLKVRDGGRCRAEPCYDPSNQAMIRQTML